MILMGTKSGRRCDARCYNAKGKKCKCVCGGINHGLGLEAAKRKMDDLMDALGDYMVEVESNLGRIEGENDKS